MKVNCLSQHEFMIKFLDKSQEYVDMKLNACYVKNPDLTKRLRGIVLKKSQDLHSHKSVLALISP